MATRAQFATVSHPSVSTVYHVLAFGFFLCHFALTWHACLAEAYDAPIIGKLPDGTWLQWTPVLLWESNGPTMNQVLSGSEDLTANVLRDGGGEMHVATGETLKCSNVQRSFINEGTCFLSNAATMRNECSNVRQRIIENNGVAVLLQIKRLVQVG